MIECLILDLLELSPYFLIDFDLSLYFFLHQVYTLFLLEPDLFPCLQLHLKGLNLTSLSILHRSLPLQLLLVLTALVLVVLNLHLKQH